MSGPTHVGCCLFKIRLFQAPLMSGAIMSSTAHFGLFRHFTPWLDLGIARKCAFGRPLPSSAPRGAYLNCESQIKAFHKGTLRFPSLRVSAWLSTGPRLPHADGIPRAKQSGTTAEYAVPLAARLGSSRTGKGVARPIGGLLISCRVVELALTGAIKEALPLVTVEDENAPRGVSRHPHQHPVAMGPAG